jgi:hypothetical protein
MLMGVGARAGINPQALQMGVETVAVGTADVVKKKKKGKRAVSAYNKAFGKAYKRQRDKMTKKNGSWKKNCNSVKCMAMAHKDTKRMMKR